MQSDNDAEQLAPCPEKPNCVSSKSSGHQWIEPIVDGENRWQQLPRMLERMPSFRIVTQGDDYIHAEARTRVLRFLDDVEFQLSRGEDVIHVRSASRLGYFDFGVNRKRLEAIRQRLKES